MNLFVGYGLFMECVEVNQKLKNLGWNIEAKLMDRVKSLVF